MTTSAEMVAMLRGHLGGAPSKPEPGFFLGELEAPLGLRRADALWLPLDSQRRGQLWGYEIKVSRSDVMAELVDPTKADAWLRYCDRWWLVISDPALIAGLDIPEHWGILGPPTGRSKRLMTVLRPAPALKPATREPAFAKVLTRLFYGDGTTESELRDLRRTIEYRDRELAGRDDRLRVLTAEIQKLGGRTSSHDREQVEQLVDAVLKVGAERGVSQWGVRADVIADAVIDHVKMTAATRAAEQRGEQIARQLQGILQNDLAPVLKAIESARVSRETSEERCTCDGGALHTTKENLARIPFIITATCPIHGSQR